MIIAKNDEIAPEFFDLLTNECIRYLKVMCTKGSTFQNLIVNTTGMLAALNSILKGNIHNASDDIEIRTFQLIGNLCVQNKITQEKIWNSLKETIIEKFEMSEGPFINVGAMIIYNLILSGSPSLDQRQVLSICLSHYQNFLNQSTTSLPDFVLVLMDFMICANDKIVEIYKDLGTADIKNLLFYIHDHIENESSETINASLLQHLMMEFKKNSDCILKTVTTYVESIDPELVVILLDVISTATGQEKYLVLLQDDRSLYLNLGCLLQTIHKAGKSSGSIFSPIQNLEALVPSSNDSGDYEKDISFSFKTKLVRSIANLSYRNKKNQELAREMEIMLSIFECTSADARNPLIKEWSILAIRNLCQDNLENQEMVRNLTKVGNADNPLLKEFGLESGTFRIGKQ